MKNKCDCIAAEAGCMIKEVENCPCGTCIVNMVCSQVCYKRRLYGAKDLKFLVTPEEEFSVTMSLLKYAGR